MRTVGRLILSAVFLLLTAALAAVANYMPELFFAFYTDFSRDALAFLSGITAPFPFAVWEVLLALIVLLALYFLVRNLAQRKGFFCNVLVDHKGFAGVAHTGALSLSVVDDIHSHSKVSRFIHENMAVSSSGLDDRNTAVIYYIINQ